MSNAAHADAPTEYVGIYDADGGVRGEVAYVVGHLMGQRECALCDITHSPVRRKRAWDRMVADLGAPFRLLHRNELSPDLRAKVAVTGLPVVLAKRADAWVTVLDAADLSRCGGDVESFRAALAKNGETVIDPGAYS